MSEQQSAAQPTPATNDLPVPVTANPQGGGSEGWMRRMLVGLALFFFLASLVQLYYLHARIAEPPGADLSVTLDGAMGRQLAGPGMNPLTLYAALEAQALNRRYHQGNVLLMSRIWVSYLSFVTGMILCLVGASFILGRIRESASTVGAESNLVKLSVSSSSPGIILACLGTVLIISSILTNHRIEIQDSAIYLGRYAAAPGEAAPAFMPPSIESPVVSDFDCALDPNGPQCGDRSQKK